MAHTFGGRGSAVIRVASRQSGMKSGSGWLAANWECGQLDCCRLAGGVLDTEQVEEQVVHQPDKATCWAEISS